MVAVVMTVGGPSRPGDTVVCEARGTLVVQNWKDSCSSVPTVTSGGKVSCVCTGDGTRGILLMSTTHTTAGRTLKGL